MWPILKIDARTQIEAAPDEQTEMRCRSANQSLITDVFALRPYFCTIQLQPIRTAMQCGARLLRPPPLTGDIRSYRLLAAPPERRKPTFSEQPQRNSPIDE